MEPTYEDLNDDGSGVEETSGKMQKKALEPKTPLQTTLLNVSGAKRFANNAERNKWKALEAPALGADADSRVHEAWLKHCILWGVYKNKSKLSITYKKVISYASNEEAMKQWKIDNREKILSKKTPAELAGETGVGTLTSAYMEIGDGDGA